MPAQVWLPEAGHGPGILLLQEIFGVTDYIKSRARDLADLGYVVVVPEVYWRLGKSPIEESTQEGLAEAMATMKQLDWPLAVTDVVGTFHAMGAMPEVDGTPLVMGFCFGGGLAYNVASALESEGSAPAGLVSYYGSALPMIVDQIPAVKSASLHHFGDADQAISVDKQDHVREVVTAGGSGEWHTWAGAGHAFDNPSPLFHDESASRDAWGVTTAWLAAHHPVEAH